MHQTDKNEILKQAIVDNIKRVYPLETLAYIGEKIDMNISDVSRLFKKKLPISIEKIIRIEKALTESSNEFVEIIKIINPNEKNEVDKLKERISLVESTLNMVSGGIKKNIQKSDSGEEKERFLSFQILSDNKFKDLFENLLYRIESEIKSKKKFLDEEYRYKFRDKRQYLSINLLPGKKTIGGYHLMFIRYSIKKRHLQFQFMVPDDEFKKEIEDFSKKEPHLVEGKLPVTFYPNKEKGGSEEECVFDGQPSLTYNRKLTTEDVENIVHLALRVLEVQQLSK